MRIHSCSQGDKHLYLNSFLNQNSKNCKDPNHPRLVEFETSNTKEDLTRFLCVCFLFMAKDMIIT